MMVSASAAAAQTPVPGDGGRTLAGVAFSGAPQRGQVALSASRCDAWQEEDGRGTTQRFLLKGDVRVALGVYTFSAAQAVVWVYSRPGVPGSPAGEATREVAVYFDRVTDSGSGAAVSQVGDRLLVTATVTGDFVLRADALRRGRPGDAIVGEAERRMARLAEGAPAQVPPVAPGPPAMPGGPVGPDGLPVEPVAPVPGMGQPFEPDSPFDEAELQRARTEALGPAERTPPIFAQGGVLTVAVRDLDRAEFTLVQGAGPGAENAAIATGGVVVVYTDTARRRALQLSAERAVVFLKPGGLLETRSFGIDSVRGVYLEGAVVATDGNTTLRGPRVYYDVQANRAVVVDAVFHVFDERRGLSLYVRAETLRQTAQNQVVAESATLANSSFFEPHLSLGATSITVTQERAGGEVGGGGPGRVLVDGRDLTLRSGDLPFFYFPRYSGEVERFPLKEVRFENSSDSGFAVKTVFDLFGLLGFEPFRGVRANLLADVYSRRGLGLGVEGGYGLTDTKGSFLAYILPSDEGRDTLTSGASRSFDGEVRGVLLAEHRWFADEAWAVFLEGAYVSDENFIDAFYETLAETRREFANAALARRIEGNTVFSLLGKGSLNDFTPNEFLLQSQGYTVDRLPDVAYQRIADDLLEGIAPGLVSYTSEFRFTAMQLNFTEKTPRELGLDTLARAQDGFGLDPGVVIGQSLRDAGLGESSVLRFDTRHEVSVPVRVGAFNVNPFVVGRLTAYDTGFEEFNGGGQDEYRVFVAAGVRAATSFSAVYGGVESRFFDLSRLRHVVEPSATLWISGTSVESDNLPVYDDAVEAIADGGAVRAALNQTFQTQRGGPGRWRSVDVLRLNTEVVFATDDAPRKTPLGRFFDYRPELSTLGEFGTVDASWLATDAVAFTLNTIYDFDLSQPARTTTGVSVQHAPDFSTFIESHYLNARDATFVSAGADYRFTDKYTLGLVATYDVDVQDFQELSARVNREFPNLIISLKLRYNNITDEVSLGIVAQPLTRDARREELRQRLGRDRPDAGLTDLDADGGGFDGGAPSR
jgi:hypothetical protein